MATTTIPAISTTRVLQLSDDFYELGSATIGSAKQQANQIPLWAPYANLLSTSAFDVTGITAPVTVIALGLAAFNDGGGGTYMYSPSSTATVNGTTILASNTGTGRWLDGASQIQADWTQATTTSPAYIKNKPTLGTAASHAATDFDASGAAAAAQAAAEAASWPVGASVGGAMTGPLNALASNPSVGVTFKSVSTGTDGLVSGGQFQLETPSPYATGGNVQIRFDLQGFARIRLSGSPSISLSPAGSGGLKAGAQQLLLLQNFSGSAFSITWNPDWQPMNGVAFPASIPNGQSMWIWLLCGGVTEFDVAAGVFDSLGAAVAALGANNNATFNALTVTGGIVNKLIGYPTGNTIGIQFNLSNAGGAFDIIPITTPTASFSPSGSGGIQPGARQTLLIYNNYGSTVSLTWQSNWNGSSFLPTTLAPLQCIIVELGCHGTTETSIYAAASSVSGGGGGGFTAAGDLSGSSTNQTVIGLQGRPVSSVGPTPGYVLGWNGTAWGPTSPGGGPPANNFNILAYGAVPNNPSLASSNVTAINNAVAAAIANGGGCIYFPGLGNWYVTALPAYSASVSLAFIGDGMSVSNIVVQTGGQNGLDVNVGSGDAGIEIRDLGIILGGGVTGGLAAIRAIPGPSSNQNNCIIRNIRIAGGNGWTNGVYVPCPSPAGIFSGVIENIFGFGQWTPSNSQSTGAFIYVENGVNGQICKWYCFNWQTGLNLTAVLATGDHTFQGITVTNFVINGAKFGISLNSSSSITNTAGAIFIDNGIIDLGGDYGGTLSGAFGVLATYVNEIKISQCYCAVNGSSPTGMNISNGGQIAIAHCDIVTAGASAIAGAILTGCPHSTIHDNTFGGWGSNDVVFGSGTDASILHDNIDVLVSNGVITYVNGGANNRIGVATP